MYHTYAESQNLEVIDFVDITSSNSSWEGFVYLTTFNEHNLNGTILGKSAIQHGFKDCDYTFNMSILFPSTTNLISPHHSLGT